MCEATYIGCPECRARASDCVHVLLVEVKEVAQLDEAGEEDCFEVQEPSEPHDNYYECTNCGHSMPRLGLKISEEGCECAQCDPSNLVGKDGLALLVRTAHHKREPVPPEAPAEVETLLKDRAISVLLITIERAEELIDWMSEEGLANNTFPVCVDSNPAAVEQYGHMSARLSGTLN